MQNNSITPQEIKDQSAQLCDLWTTLIDDQPPMRKLRDWLLHYDLQMIDGAIRACGSFVTRQKEPDKITTDRKLRYIARCLDRAAFNNKTPEQLEQELSDKRAAAGQRGAYEKHRKERLKISQSLLGFARSCQTLPESNDNDNEIESDVEMGNDSEAAPPIPLPLFSTASLPASHNTGGTSRPPSPTASPSSAELSPAARPPNPPSPLSPSADDDLDPIPVATARDRRYAASLIADALHHNFVSRSQNLPDFIPRNGRNCGRRTCSRRFSTSPRMTSCTRWKQQSMSRSRNTM